MRLFLHGCCFASSWLLLTGRGEVAWGQAPQVEVVAVRQCHFPTELGKAYQFEGAVTVVGSESVNWQALGEVVFGTGEPRCCEVRPDTALAGLTQFRLREMDPASVGLARVHLPLGTLSLVHDGVSDQWVFFHGQKGVLHPAMETPRTFAWEYVKTGVDEGLLQAKVAGGLEVAVRLHFIHDSSGSYVRTISLAGTPVQDTDAGVFALSSHQVWHGNAEGRMPTDLVGRMMTMQLAGQPIKFTFGATELTRQVGNEPGVTVPYVYEPETATMGVIHVALSPMLEERYTLTAKSATSGETTRQVVAATGYVKDEQDGSFGRPADPPPPVNGDSETCGAPNNLDDVVLDFSSENTGLITKDFNQNGEGTQVSHDGGSIDQSSFTFSYTKIDAKTGRIVSVMQVLGGTQIDVTTLHFTSEDAKCSGTWDRASSRDGVTIPGSSGSFGPGNPPPTS